MVTSLPYGYGREETTSNGPLLILLSGETLLSAGFFLNGTAPRISSFKSTPRNGPLPNMNFERTLGGIADTATFVGPKEVSPRAVGILSQHPRGTYYGC